jgi:hypothetical protein
MLSAEKIELFCNENFEELPVLNPGTIFVIIKIVTTRNTIFFLIAFLIMIIPPIH